jgi:hypothetical protein
MSKGHRFENAILNQHPQDGTRMSWFLKFLPVQFMQEVILVETNKNIEGKQVEWPEFLRFLGLLLLMSTVLTGYDRRSWFEDSEPSPSGGAPFRIQKYMSRHCFETILSALRYTNKPFPQFRDKFHQTRALIGAWNEHMKEVFIPSWMSCLDESMSPWTSRWTCPGWMYVPRKPHPMGNEYHTICCGHSGIMYAIELVEGKDHPKEMPNPAYNDLGATCGLLLQLTRSIWSTGKIVILDSGFCVLKAIIELKKKGVYASALIKKRRYWPRDVPGEDIRKHFDGKQVGHTDRLPGTSDGLPFDIFAMKEPDYVMMFMSTYGSLVEAHDAKMNYRGSDERNDLAMFKYMEVIGNHYKYRGAVDEHNSKRHDGGTGVGVSLEASWATTRWENRVFSFILAISEVNAFIGRRYFDTVDLETQIDFRRKLSMELVLFMDEQMNNEATIVNRPRTRQMRCHELLTAPSHSKFMVGKWEKCLKRKYQAFTCSDPKCHKRIRTYCSCSPHLWRCHRCFATHYASVITET